MNPSVEQDAIRAALAGQRQAIVDKLEDCALHVLATADEDGAPIIAEALRQAAEIARWTIYDPEVGR